MAGEAGRKTGILMLAIAALAWGAWLLWFAIHDPGGRWWIGLGGAVLALIGAQGVVEGLFRMLVPRAGSWVVVAGAVVLVAAFVLAYRELAAP